MCNHQRSVIMRYEKKNANPMELLNFRQPIHHRVFFFQVLPRHTETPLLCYFFPYCWVFVSNMRRLSRPWPRKNEIFLFLSKTSLVIQEISRRCETSSSFFSSLQLSWTQSGFWAATVAIYSDWPNNTATIYVVRSVFIVDINF